MVGSISPFSAIPVRKLPEEQSALETQILFGEVFFVLEQVKGWSRVRLGFDDYEGWVDEKYVLPSSDLEIERWNNSQGLLVSTPFNKLLREPYKSVQLVSAGSRIYFNGEDRNSFTVGHLV